MPESVPATATGKANRMSASVKAADLPTDAIRAELHRRYDHLSRAIALTLRDEVHAAGLSHRDISAETGIPPSTVQHRLSGNSKLYLDDVIRIAYAVGVNPSTVIDRAQVRASGLDS